MGKRRSEMTPDQLARARAYDEKRRSEMTPEQLEQQRAYQRKYHQEHRDKRLARMRTWAQEHPEKRRAYARTYNKAHPETRRRWKDANREQNRAKGRAYYRRRVADGRVRAYRWSPRAMLMQGAALMVRGALRMGLLKKKPCEECGEEKSQAHHEDYARPFDVRWLCGPCHLRHHGHLRASGDFVSSRPLRLD